MPHPLLAAGAVAIATGLLSAQVSNAPCFEPNYGTLLGNGDDTVFSAMALGFPFPYAGTTYNDIEVSTNGFVWLGANNNFNSRCCNGNGLWMTQDPPSIAALWTDLVSDFGGASGVYFNALPGRAVVTWDNVREYGTSVPVFTIQMQLTAAGEVTCAYSSNTAIQFHSTVAGITPGNNTPDPGSTDLSAVFPGNSLTEPTIYEEWPGSSFDLAGTAFELIPNSLGGFLILPRSTCTFVAGSFAPYGYGCLPPAGRPQPDFYEQFPNGTFDLSQRAFELLPIGSDGYLVNPTSPTAFFGGFANAVPHGDDTTVQQTLPFGFPFPNGFTNVVGQCANGFLWLDPSQTSAPFYPNVPELLRNEPRIAALWTDLDPSAGGTLFYDVVNPSLVAFTWANVLEIGGTGTATFQIQLDASGRIVVVYQTVVITAHPALVGFSRGFGVTDPGPIDLSASMPFPAGGQQQAMQIAQEGSNPRLATNFGLRIDNQPANATTALLLLGLQQRSTPLDPLGMPSCKQYASADALLFQPAGAPTIFTVAIPNAPQLLGFSMFSQAAVLAPGFNALGIAASNGGRLTIGQF